MLSLTFGRFCSIAAWRVSIGLSWKDVESLTCGCNFDQSLEDVTFPSSLKSIIFGAHFDQSLKHVRFASDIRSLTFGANFNQSLEFSLPSRLESLVFGELFKQSLKTSTFGEAFDQSLKEIDWPSNLQTLAFGFCFDQSLKDVTWLAVSECFRSYFISLWLIVYVRWCPDSTKGDFARQSLKFDLWRSVFNQSMEAVILPEIGCLIGFTTLGKIRMKHYHHGNSCPQGRTLTSLWRHHVHLPPSLRTVCCQSLSVSTVTKGGVWKDAFLAWTDVVSATVSSNMDGWKNHEISWWFSGIFRFKHVKTSRNSSGTPQK